VVKYFFGDFALKPQATGISLLLSIGKPDMWEGPDKARFENQQKKNRSIIYKASF